MSNQYSNLPNDNWSDPESAAVERALRISELRAEMAALTGQPVAEYSADSPTSSREELFFAHIEAIESGPTMPLVDLLKERRNFTPVPPDRLDHPIDISENLWLLLYALASMRVFIYDTNHLSDSELYELLVNNVLQGPATILPNGAYWNSRISICEVCDEGRSIPLCYLRYYAEEAVRQDWANDFPELHLPPKEIPPYDRDHFLPNLC